MPQRLDLILSLSKDARHSCKIRKCDSPARKEEGKIAS
jgi:hypothetical protein